MGSLSVEKLVQDLRRIVERGGVESRWGKAECREREGKGESDDRLGGMSFFYIGLNCLNSGLIWVSGICSFSDMADARNWTTDYRQIYYCAC